MGKGKYQKTKYSRIFRYVGTKGTVYGIDYYAGGKKHREIIGSVLTEAQQELQRHRNMAWSGNFLSMSGRNKVTFTDLAEKYRELQKGEIYFEKTRRFYVNTVEEFFTGRKIYQISPLDIEDYKKKRKARATKWKKVRSDVAVNRELETLRHMLNKALEWGMLAENPFNKFRSPIFFGEDENRIRYLTEEEMKRLSEVLDRQPPARRKENKNAPPSYSYLKNIIMAALLTGLRRGDILNLRWAEVDLDKGLVLFNERKKMNRQRVKALNTAMINLLKGTPHGESEFISNGPDGQPLNGVKRSFKTVFKVAKFKDFHFHDLRHSSASYMVMRVASLKAVQEHLGHNSLATAQKYAHLGPEFQRAEVEKLSGVFTGGFAGSKNLARNDQKPDFPTDTKNYANA